MNETKINKRDRTEYSREYAKKIKRLNFVLDLSEYEIFKEISKKQGLSVGTSIRQLIYKFNEANK